MKDQVFREAFKEAFEEERKRLEEMHVDIQVELDRLGDEMRKVTVEEMRETLYQHVPEDERPELEIIEWEEK